MIAKEFTEFVGKKPFRPYRITLSDGRSFDITNYDFGVVGIDSVIIGISKKGQQQTDPVDEVLISLSHVMQMEYIGTQPSTSGKGNGKK